MSSEKFIGALRLPFGGSTNTLIVLEFFLLCMSAYILSIKENAHKVVDDCVWPVGENN